MNSKQKELLKQLEHLACSKFEKSYIGVKGFAYYFSRLDIKGVESVLSDGNTFDGYSKECCIEMIQMIFESLRTQGVKELKVYQGRCSGCHSSEGLTFIDENTGNFIDIIIDHDGNEITFFKECLGLVNINKQLDKNDRWIIDPLRSCCYGFNI